MRYVKAFFLFLIVMAFVVFAVVNRAGVTLSLFPFPYEVRLPAFLLALGCFALGAIAGWLLVSVKLCKTKRLAKTEHKRAQALENEVKALHVEQEQRPLPAAIAAHS